MAEKKYFLFSAEQLEYRRRLEEKMGKTYRAGNVIVRGVNTPYTELSKTSKSRFSDAKVVLYEDPSRVRYTPPRSE